MKKFYSIAWVLMAISVFGQIWNLKATWMVTTIGSKISSIAGGVLFSFLLACLFFYFWKVTPSGTGVGLTKTDSVIENKELDDLLIEMSKK